MKQAETSARAHCANYDRGKCLGVIIQTKKSKNAVGLRQILNTKKAGKDCTVSSGCQYFDNCVVPGLREW